MSDEVAVARAAAREAGRIALDHAARGLTAEWKGARDLVTAADRAAQARIREVVAEAFPTDLVVDEEGEASPGEDEIAGTRRWYVDPIDGTTNYLKGRHWWGVSIAFCDTDDELAAGVVYLPALGQTYEAVRGGGAMLDGEPIRCSPVTELAEALCCSGFPGSDSMADISRRNIEAWRLVMARALSLRATGAVAPDWCTVASGRADGSWTLGVGRWDIAAGIVIAREAGATVTDLDGIALRGPGERGVAATPGIHADLLSLVQAALDVPEIPRDDGTGGDLPEGHRATGERVNE
ncbi:inositol monophosphatase family protein [Egibacter rhizosphaerae]|uniref:inositol monophosphatase family protein n=1 Tax=Egibacter rhizosphaerae TaxID=1670831 RepID=UPI0013F16275|nr:inositol monophosphatase family protein [Egibacter rhizosphaerae]